MSPSPVSRETSRDFVALDRLFNDGRVQNANVAVSPPTVSANIIDDLIFMLRAKRSLCLRNMADIDETAETGVSDQRGRQQSFTQAAPNELKLGEAG